jgi:hypothetical protein
MTIEGRIAVDVSFADKADGTNVQSLKRISIADATSYTTGKVAIVTGTCGTAQVSIDFSPSTYRNAEGNVVSFSTVKRIAFSATAPSPGTLLQDSSGTVLRSVSGSVAVCDSTDSGDDVLSAYVVGESGTTSYTIVLYGT